MKSSLLKDTFREISNTLGRFLSIFAIVALGVGFFAGIKATAPDMKITADKYFDDYRLMDLQLISTMGFNKKDLEEIKKVEGIQGISPSYSIDAIIKERDNSRVVKLISIPMDKVGTKDESYINRVNLVKGRYPEKSGECLVESGSMTTESLPLGSTIKLSSGTDEDISESLKTDEYTIVGLVENPSYISFERGTSTIGNGKIDSFIMIPEEDFSLPVYTDIYITVKKARDVLTYDDEYDSILTPIQKDLEDVGEVRKESRYQEIVDEANEKLDEGRRELKDGEEKQEKELYEAEQKLVDAKNQIQRGEKELANKEDELYRTTNKAGERLREEEDKLKKGEAEYYKNLDLFNEMKDKGNKELKEAESKIISAEREIEKQVIELNQLKLSLDSIQDPEEKAKTSAMIEVSEKKIEEAKKQISSSRMELEKKKQEFILGEQKLKAAKRTIDEGKVKLEEEKKRLENSKTKALGEFAKGHRELDSSKKEYEEGYAEYLKAKKKSDEKIQEARDKIAKGEKELKEIEKPKWYVIKRNQTRDFIDYEMAADRIDAVAKVFPVFFFVIAVLVCLTTMTRMVDEQRTYIGSLKAMGYKNISIASKYLIYAAVASLGGSIIGLLVGFKAFPTVIFNAYRIMYIMPPVITEFNTYYAVVSTLVAVIATTMAAWIACYNELVETPAFLLRPKAPKPGQRIFLERINSIWSRLKFSQKVTARNLFRYKRRLFMTIIGISGCTALLLTGFGLKDSIMSIAIKQFDEIYRYQMVIELKDSMNEGKRLEFLDSLKEDSRIKDYTLIKEQTMDIGKGDIEKNANLIVFESPNRVEDFVVLRNRTTGEKIHLYEDGIILTEKMAKLLNVEIGDEIYIKDEDGSRLNVKITGITENYANHYIYMSRNTYEEVFGERVKFQKLLVKTTDTDKAFEDNLSKDLLKNHGISSINFITGISKSFKDMIGSLNYVIMVLIFSAGALAFVVLYNLTNINISERIREIATIKVLGFYDREVSKYVYRENMILTIMGTILGLVLGVFLHRFVIFTTEIEFIMFGREIRAVSYVYSAILTIVFAVLVNFVMYFKLKKVDMVESLKSID